MQLNLIGRNLDITEAIQSFVNEKILSLQKRYDHITSAHVILHVENFTHIAEATLHLNGKEIHAKGKDEDMYQAIEILIDKLLGQITTYKEKSIEQHQK